MLFITEDALVVCKHETGRISNAPSQGWFTVAKRRVLVEPDPVGRTISGCPMLTPMKPCVTTLPVISGYSNFIRVGEKLVCLDTITGLTDGTPPGLVRYKVNSAGQFFVQETS